MLPYLTAARHAITAIPMETQELLLLRMVVPSLDCDALAVLFLKAVTLAGKGEHVGNACYRELGSGPCFGVFCSGGSGTHCPHSLAGWRAVGWAMGMGSALPHRQMGTGEGGLGTTLGFG